MSLAINKWHLLGAVAVVWGLAMSAALIIQHAASTRFASQAEVQTLQKRLSQLEIPSVQPPTASPDDVATLRKELEAKVTTIAQALEDRATLQALRHLEQRIERLEDLPPAPVPTLAEPKPQPAPKPRPRAAIPTPFQIIGVELRGAERFLAVTPHNALSLEQTKLLRVGDTHERWTLEALESSTAAFRINGVIRRLPVP